jgi:uncharacterized protein with PQ loop repeat
MKFIKNKEGFAGWEQVVNVINFSRLVYKVLIEKDVDELSLTLFLSQRLAVHCFFVSGQSRST